jgi:hypothetical protein
VLPLDAIVHRLNGHADRWMTRGSRTLAGWGLIDRLGGVGRRTGAATRRVCLAAGLRGNGEGRRAPEYVGLEATSRPISLTLRAPVDQSRGGTKRAPELARWLATVEDLLYHLPFRYEDRRVVTRLGALVVGSEVSTEGEVARVRHAVVGRGRRRVLEVALRDGADVVLLVWFNQVGYFAQRFSEGQRLLVHGRVDPPLGNGPSRIVIGRDRARGRRRGIRAAVLPIYEADGHAWWASCAGS